MGGGGLQHAQEYEDYKPHLFGLQADLHVAMEYKAITWKNHAEQTMLRK